MNLFSILKRLFDRRPGPTVSKRDSDTLVFPFEPGWKVGHEQEVPGQFSILEMIREEDDIENWKELFTIQDFRKQQQHQLVTAEGFLLNLKAAREREAPGSTKWNVIGQDDTSILYEWEAKAYPGWPDQHEIARIINGERNLFLLRYTAKSSQMSLSMRDDIINKLSEARIQAGGPA